MVAGALMVAVGVIGGCANPGPAVPPARFSAPDTLGVNPQVKAEQLAADWWRELGDPQLSQLIERALEGAPSLRIVQARLMRSQALTDGARGAFEPLLLGAVDVNRQLFSANAPLPASLAGNIRNLGGIQSTMAWEFDFFGRNQAALEAAIGAQRAARADGQAARALLASQVARAYGQLVRLLEQHTLLEALLAQREQLVALRTERLAAGLESSQLQRQAQANASETRSQLALLAESVALARNALAALSAQPPAALAALTPPARLGLRLAVPADVPADLMGRRADLVAARWRVESALSDVGVARAQFYPNINLNALLGLSSIGLDRLLRAGSLQAGVSPAVRLPLFDGLRLRANLRGRQAELDAAIESYNQRLLEAVREVADQLTVLKAIERQQAEQVRAAELAESLRALAEQRYRAGIGDWLAVVGAEAGILAQRQQDAELRARRIDSQLALIHALGGGYGGDTPATP